MRRILLILALTATAVPAFAAPVIDNERVTVWDVTLKPGETAPPTTPGQDSVILILEGGTLRLADGTTHKAGFGDAFFQPKGGAGDTLMSGGPAHEILVSLKDHAEPPVANSSGLPAAFPRPGSVKILENAKVIVWRYSWTKGKPTAMHFHDKDVVVTYRYDGTLKSITPDGVSTDNPYKKGEIRFNKANRTHSELLTTDRQSAVILELK